MVRRKIKDEELSEAIKQGGKKEIAEMEDIKTLKSPAIKKR